MYIITMDVCIRLGVLQKGKATLGPYGIYNLYNLSHLSWSGEKYTSDDTKTKIIFVVGQWVYMFLMLLPAPLCFYLRFLNTSFLSFLILAGIWRGGSYYIFKFSKSYNQKFEMPNKEN